MRLCPHITGQSPDAPQLPTHTSLHLILTTHTLTHRSPLTHAYMHYTTRNYLQRIGLPESKTSLALAISGTAKIVYVAAETTLSAVAVHTRATLWEKTFPKVIGTPVLGGQSKLLVTVGDSQLVSLDATNGQEQWRYDVDVAGGLYRSTPSVELPVKRVYIGSKGGLHAVHLDTGARLWFFDSNVALGSFIAWLLTTPAIGPGSMVIMGSLSGHVLGVNGTTGALLWSIAVAGPVFGSAAM